MAQEWQQELLQALPAVDVVFETYKRSGCKQGFPRQLVVTVIREVLEELRSAILSAGPDKNINDFFLSPAEVALQSEKRLLELLTPSQRRVINATGTVLHTNLGRAPLAKAAIEAVNQVAGYCNLEHDLSEGKRGSRQEHVESLLVKLTGAEAACVTNNNAAAVLLCLNTVASGKKVIVSRGELVEIGGSFRVPEIMAASGARLVEVGTTNKTRAQDYSGAVDEETALILKVHTSNYKVVGFTEDVKLPELASIAREKGVLVMDDLGSGLLVDLSAYGLEKEPLVAEQVAAGADLVAFSGDKLLGGPQAGIIAGRRELVQKVKENHLMRSLRPDKLTLAALEATLRIYLTGNPLEEIPILSMLSAPSAVLEQRAHTLAAKLASRNLEASVVEDFSYVGGGAMPLTRLGTFVVAVQPQGVSFPDWARALRQENPALVGRVRENKLLLDLRTIAAEEEEEVIRCLT